MRTRDLEDGDGLLKLLSTYDYRDQAAREAFQAKQMQIDVLRGSLKIKPLYRLTPVEASEQV